MRSSTCFTSASSALMRSDTSRIRAMTASGFSPRRLAWPMASEVRLRSALRVSTSVTSRRRSASAARISGTSSAPPRVARPR